MLYFLVDKVFLPRYNINVKQTIHGGGSMKNRIMELRKERKISQEELADAVMVTRQTIISLEKGKYIASLPLAYKISKYFGITIEELFDFSEEGGTEK